MMLLFYPSLLAHYKGHPDIQNLLKEYGGVEDPSPEQRTGHNHKKGSSTQKTATASGSANQAAKDKSVEKRLQTLQELKNKDLISEEEYSEARREILEDL